ncbi:efflux RND transporter periplasmic adaptor subunit [Limimaricola hongkongensis]|uniref:Efflux transporter, RND family, MFP subunit n=1 Tax=Limimaricola hongkongensis DSM 17492 TaxID=1122180 RepID=A0A017HAU9_9RHOB|nr:efflux RND transporter periplasmic adaptor subunit [Limimaricola hongkongensis]EYD70914.1 Efflux transporter, RND family, MFP subunit [Limimaricola hongkongensis DSM 17492]
MIRILLTALTVALGAGQAVAQDAPRPVKLVTVSPETGGLSRQFFGRIAARQTVDLAFQVGGQIVEYPVLEGETVADGGLVAALDPEPFELAHEQAKLRKDQADRDLERLSQLSRSTVSEAALQDARTAASLAQVELRDAERAREKARLQAPFEALLAERLVANFTTVAAGTPVARLHDMSELQVEIEVPEILFQRAGRDPDMALSARFPGGSDSYPLSLAEVTSQSTAVGQTFRLTLSFDAAAAPQVLPGSSVTVTAKLAGGAAGLPVPTTALVPAADGSVSVMLFQEDENGARVIAHPVEVEPGADGGFVVTDGLSGGEEIVAAGASRLEDGEAVRRFTGFPQ